MRELLWNRKYIHPITGSLYKKRDNLSISCKKNNRSAKGANYAVVRFERETLSRIYM